MAPATRIKYATLWRQWVSYCKANSFSPLPATSEVVSLFLASLAAGGTRTTVPAASAAIAWHHTVAGFASPTGAPSVVAVVAGARRLLAAAPRRMKPFTVDLLRRLVRTLADSVEFEKQRLLFYSVIAFFACFRFSDMLQLKVENFTISDHLKIHLESSKCDQLRKGNDILLAGLPDSDFCPVSVARKFLALLSTCANFSSDVFVLSNVRKSPRGMDIMCSRLSNGALTRQLRAALAPLVADITKFSPHSFRSGGATAAAAGKTPRDLLKRHGRWKSDCVDTYIDVPKASRLSVSRTIAQQ